MKIAQLIEELKSYAAKPVDESRTCDTVKTGDADRALTKAAVAMFPTPNVVKAAAEWGAELLIVHEPCYYNHLDNKLPYALAHEKKALLESSGLTVFRFHDGAHAMMPDLISHGEVKYMGLKGEYHEQSDTFTLAEPMTARELAKHLEKQLDIRHIRIAGCTDRKGTSIGLCLGAPANVAEMLESNDFVLTGEIYEWREGELARDYAQLGYNKAIILMGHEASERDGMRLLCDMLAQTHKEFESRYFESGEVYTYTD